MYRSKGGSESMRGRGGRREEGEGRRDEQARGEVEGGRERVSASFKVVYARVCECICKRVCVWKLALVMCACE